MRVGNAIVTTYVLVYLTIPCLLAFALGQPLQSSYVYGFSSLSVIALIALPILVGIDLNKSTDVSHAVYELSGATGLVGLMNRYAVYIAGLMLVVSVYLASLGLQGARYASAGVASAGGSAILLFLYKGFINLISVWFVLAFLRAEGAINRRERIATGLVALSTILLAGGTGDFWLASGISLIAIAPRAFFKVCGIDRLSSSPAFSFCLKASLIPALLFLSMVAASFGTAIKSGDVSSFTLDSESFALIDIFERLREGLAHHFYSFNAFMTGYAYDALRGYEYPLSYPIGGFLYRISVLLGDSGEVKPPIQLIAKLNFEIISWRISAQEGTSPGALASFYYVVNNRYMPYIIAVIYFRFVAMIINRGAGLVYLSPFGMVMFLLYFKDFFDSPLDVLVVLDSSVVMFFGMILMLLGLHKYDRKQEFAAGVKSHGRWR